jgi:hypothetical protein
VIRPLFYVLGGVAATYIVLCGLTFAFQRSLQYFPDQAPMDPAAVGLPSIMPETLATTDGERLVVWWSPPSDPGKPSFLYLHGNGANLMARGPRLRRLIAGGNGLMAVSWRGYGGSTGAPTEAGFLADARAAYALLVARVDPARLVIVGESIGTGIAARLAAETRPAGLILDSSFTSTADIAAALYPWLPVRLLMRDQFRADLAAPDIAAPVLQLHCRDDPVTPLALAGSLQPLFRNARPMTIVEGRCHTVPLDDFDAAVRAFVAQLPSD